MLYHSKLSRTGTICIVALMVAVTITSALALPSFIHATRTLDGITVQPERVAVAPNGIVYLSEPQSNRILAVSTEGIVVGSIPVANVIAVGVLPNGSLLASHGTQVDCYNANGTFQFSLGNGIGEFNKAGEIAVATDGSIYVTDTRQHVVKVYQPDGTFRFAFGSRGSANGQFVFPTGIALSANETEVFVADQGNSRINVYSRTGSYLRSFGRATYQVGSSWVFDGTFTRVQGISVDQLNRLYISDLYQNDVQVLSAQGEFLGRIVPGTSLPFAHPADLVVSGNQLYILSTFSNQVFAYSIDGVTSVNNPAAAIVSHFALNNNYPNPFNGTTRIPFALKQNGKVSLTIWNVLGQQVGTLINANMNAGYHEVVWNTTSGSYGAVTSGVYYCKLSVVDESGTSLYQSTGKMLFLK
ncbi:MAG: 6-bladed beta-propeller [bacterium]|nr:6-bladed beta-propeller [bacterium]